MYDAETGRELTDTEAAEAQAALQRAQEELMRGHAERVASYEKAKRGARAHRMRQDLTGAQRHKRATAAADIALAQRIGDSGLWTGVPRSRTSWCARLRELELHPERFEAIRDRNTTAQAAQVGIPDEVGADA